MHRADRFQACAATWTGIFLMFSLHALILLLTYVWLDAREAIVMMEEDKENQAALSKPAFFLI